MLKKILSIILSLIMVLGLIPISAAGEVGGETTRMTPVFSDMPEDWSTQALQNAVNNGLLNGADGKIMPKENLTRAQMAAIINRAFGAEVKADISNFNDVPNEAWFFDEMAKSVHMGTFQGSNNNLKPNDPITRQEAFIVIARALKLKNTEEEIQGYNDLDQISSWAKEEVQSIIQNGYVKGSNGNINPKGNITRAEFAQLMDNIIKHYINEEGEYTEIPEGNIMINVPEVTLKDVTVTGDLIIGDGVGEGDVTLDNVEVTGRMIVRGGGENSIIIKGNSKVGQLTVSKVDGNIRVYTEDGSEVEVVYIDDGKEKVTIEGNIKNLVVQSETEISIQDANIDKITLQSPKSNIIIGETSTVKNIEIEKEAEESTVKVDGTVNTLTTSSPKTNIEGEGILEEVQLLEGADESTVKTPNTTIIVEENVQGAVGTGDNELEPGLEYINSDDIEEDSQEITEEPLPPVGGGGGGGSTTPPTNDEEDTEAPVITLNGEATVNVEYGSTYIDEGATAADNIDGNLTSSIIVGGDTVDTTTAGTYVITYNVTDTSGNVATEVIRTVIVAEEEKSISGTISLPNNELAPEGGIFVTIKLTPADIVNTYSERVLIPENSNSTEYEISTLPGEYKLGYSLSLYEEFEYVNYGYYSANGTITDFNLATFIDITETDVEGRNLELLKGNAISGTISLPNEELAPEGGISMGVSAYGGYPNFYSSIRIEEGQNSASYHIRVLDGSYKINYSTSSNEYVNEGYFSDNGTTVESSLASEVVVSGENISEKNIELIKGNKISGTISLPNGKVAPEGGIDLGIRIEESTFSRSVDVSILEGENSGNFYTRVPNGSYKLWYNNFANPNYVKWAYYSDSVVVSNYNIATLIEIIDQDVSDIDMKLVEGNIVSGSIFLPEEMYAPSGGIDVRVELKEIYNSWSTGEIYTVKESSDYIDYRVRLLEGDYRFSIYSFYDDLFNSRLYYSQEGTTPDYNSYDVVSVPIDEGVQIDMNLYKKITLESTYPFQNQQDYYPKYTYLNLVFSEDMKDIVDYSNISITSDTGDIVELIDVYPGVTAPNNVIIVVNDNLNLDTNYTLEIPANTFKSLNEIPYEESISINFKTAHTVLKGNISADFEINGAKLELINASGTSVQETLLTDGGYRFTDMLPGDYTIKVTSTSGTEYTKDITIIQDTLNLIDMNIISTTGVSISPSAITLKTGESFQLEATILPEDATNQNLTWTSSDERRITVDSSGIIIAKGAGLATVSVITEDNSYTDDITVEVLGQDNAVFIEGADGTIEDEFEMKIVDKHPRFKVYTPYGDIVIFDLNVENLDLNTEGSTTSLGAISLTVSGSSIVINYNNLTIKDLMNIYLNVEGKISYVEAIGIPYITTDYDFNNKLIDGYSIKEDAYIYDLRYFDPNNWVITRKDQLPEVISGQYHLDEIEEVDLITIE